MIIGGNMSESVTLATEFASLSSTLNLEPFFAPKGVAVVGAAPKRGNQGKRIVDSMVAQGYEGHMIAVHPEGLSLGACHSVRSIEDLPDDIDLAIAATSAERVEAMIEPLTDKGIHNLIVVSGGFAETGPEGMLKQTSLKKTATRFGMRVVGPNCLGTFSSSDKFNSFFLSYDDIHLPAMGSVAVVSQSGAFLSAILDQLASRSVGVHRAINLGNRIDVGECEMLEAFARDPRVKVIGIYLESVQDGRRLYDIARKITPFKPVVICKGGKGDKGSRATQSHSASLAVDYSVFQAVCRQTGMIEVNGLVELISALQVLQNGPIPQGNRVLIVSNGGGMGVLLTDLLENGNCDVVETPHRIQQDLKNSLPGYYSFRNPIDLTGSGTNEQCVLAIDRILKTGLYDCLLLVVLAGTEGINADIAKSLRDILPRDIPVVLGAYGQKLYSSVKEAFAQEEIPVFPTGEESAWAVNLLVQWGRKKAHTIPVSEELNALSFSPRVNEVGRSPVWDEMQIKRWLQECNIQVPKSYNVTCREELDSAIRQMGLPIVLKLVAPDLMHKTELHGIELNLIDRLEIEKKWQNMNENWPGKIWVEEQLPAGLDVMVGMCRDAIFGPLLLFGTGGSYVETYEDIERVLLPASDAEIVECILRTKAGEIIQGVRGQRPLALSELVRFIKWMMRWVASENKLVSLDFNPIRLYPDRLVVLDAKANLEP
jgi:acyl-CoA synthetase (NDP forming)